MKEKKEKKQKEQKPVYIDDGSTVFDMSGLDQTKKYNRKKSAPTQKSVPAASPSRWKDCLQTYWGAVKMMFLPMLVVIAIICVVFLLMYWLL